MLQQSWFIPGKDDLFLASLHTQETGIGVNLQGDKQGSNKAGHSVSQVNKVNKTNLSVSHISKLMIKIGVDKVS